MILKRFIDKSNKKYVKKSVLNRVVQPNDNKINSIGVLVDNNEFADIEWINNLAQSLKVNQNQLKILSYFNPKKEEISVFTNTFAKKDLSWNGQFKSQIAKGFVNTSFDLLINLYQTNDLALQVATAATNATLKVGLNNTNPELNDLIINVNINDKSVFKTELIKYLNILNKLK
ncbi:hypothetical protein DZC78_00085 [Olleya aquimaris]|nr:hypothetical protein DZC78_00085 [Olleya aquimaris]